jgi:Family of unknown function (DUF6519)
MKGDFSRFGFDWSKHYSVVLHQQGRVALDSDANQSSAVLLHHLRALTRDLYGDFGGPANSGFTLALDSSVSPPLLWIGPGHYYVHGILCENEDWVDYGHQADYAVAQPDESGAGGDALLAWLRNPVQSQRFWVYLDVWEHHVTWIEDDSIREPALGGPDTTTRAKVVWQVKALPWNPDWGDANSDSACALPLPSQVSIGSGRMAARVDPGPAFTDPCVIAPTAQYRGAENHLYRIEIHTGGDAASATFMWSRENGSVATRWLGIGNDPNSLIVKSSRGFAANDWIEVSHDALDLAGMPGQLVRLSVVDGDQLTIDAASVPTGGIMSWADTLSNPKVRRWDQRTNDVVSLRDGAVPITESAPEQPEMWITLEDGVQVAFAAGGQYRSGDYWVVAARVATQGIDWPLVGGQPAWRGPLGIGHAFAPLGVMSTNGEGIQLDLCRRCVELSPIACTVASPPSATADAPQRATPGIRVRKPAAAVPTEAARKRRKPS